MASLHKSILIAVDLEKTDKVLLQQGLGYAKAFNSEVYIIHIAAPDPDFVGYEVGPEYIRESRADTLRSEHRLLQDHMESFKKEGIDCSALLIQGPTIDMLITELEKLGSDLLIMGEHKHGFLYDTLIGHSSSKILKHVSIPVLIIPLLDEK